jgi:hypothetical protein
LFDAPLDTIYVIGIFAKSFAINSAGGLLVMTPPAPRELRIGLEVRAITEDYATTDEARETCGGAGVDCTRCFSVLRWQAMTLPDRSRRWDIYLAPDWRGLFYPVTAECVFGATIFLDQSIHHTYDVKNEERQ